MKNHAVVALLLFALLVRGAALLLTPDALAGDPDGYRHLAANLLENGVLGHDASPTAFRPPLYPLLLTPCVAAGSWCRVVIGVLHLALGLATVWLTWRLGRQCGLGRYALLAAALVACDPILLAQSTRIMTETPAALLVALGLVALVSATRQPTAARVAGAGAVLALGGLCRPELLAWGVAALVLLSFSAEGRGGGGRQRVRILATGLCAGAVVLAPWAVRNWAHFGRPVLTTTHGGYTLLLGNNPEFYDYLDRGPQGEVWDSAAFHQAWHRRVVAAAPLDELATDQMAYADAWQTIGQRPATFLYASSVRVGRLWQLAPHRSSVEQTPGGGAGRWAIGAWYALELLLAVLGVWSFLGGDFASHRWSTAMLYGLLAAGCFTAIHAFYWSNMRMRGPLAVPVALAAATGAAWTVDRLCRRKP